MIFDSHAHYDDEQFEADRYELLDEIHKSGIDRIVNVASDIKSSYKCIELSEKYDWIYASAGIHPEFADTVNDETLAELEGLFKRPKVVALGEIGLDYYYDNVPRDVQREAFRRQLELAVSLDVPVIIHDREAHGDILSALKAFGGRVKGIMHCFSGSREFAAEMLRLGFYISFSGSVTFKNARKLSEAAEFVPSDRILAETDCPYLAPVPNRGKRNSSLFLPDTIRFLANLRSMTYDEMCRITYENACRVFGIN
ncbi:MAG: TatD family hydrolase [Clostridia bacterium]|nr:TatD family hydrolase [Clostridia bacterium]